MGFGYDIHISNVLLAGVLYSFECCFLFDLMLISSFISFVSISVSNKEVVFS